MGWTPYKLAKEGVGIMHVSTFNHEKAPINIYYDSMPPQIHHPAFS